MNRRTALQAALGLAWGTPLMADVEGDRPGPRDFDAAANLLARNVASGLVDAASLYVRHGSSVFTSAHGEAKDEQAIFLLASISKPISIAAVMTLYDAGEFALEDRVSKFLPDFTGQGRQRITMRQLMTHVSGLPDQLPENARLRAGHAGLPEFVDGAIRTPLLFEPGARYSYSSMGILLAAEVARRISGKPFAELVEQTVFRPLGMQRSAMGMGALDRASLMRCQVERSAPESGAGDPKSETWDWNSDYWRQLGAPWGGAHGSAVDVARFLDAFVSPSGKVLRRETAREMIANHNRPGLRPRGLGFDLGKKLGGILVSDQTFGHGGSTGTLCWADPKSDTVCVVLTTLPSRAADPHPRQAASELVTRAVNER